MSYLLLSISFFRIVNYLFFLRIPRFADKKKVTICKKENGRQKLVKKNPFGQKKTPPDKKVKKTKK